MKIGIINFHFAHNFGAILECVALQNYIKSMGHEACVINYRPEYMVQSYAVYPNPIKYAKRANRDFADRSFLYRCYRMFRRFIQALTRYKDVETRKKRNIAYESFIKKNINLTKLYKTLKDLQECPPECDIYISGSDQIWNPYVTNGGLDRAYFLDFGKADIKRVAYAVSPSQLEVGKYKEELIELLGKYDSISLREKQYQHEINRLTGKKIDVCIDPTLLLVASDYTNMEETLAQCPEEYILVYGFIDREDPDTLKQCINYLRNVTNLPVIDISYFQMDIPFKHSYIKAVSPGQFLTYIKNAKYIVTNSFHGTAFSLIYHKDFWSVERKSTASRMHELMVNVGLSERLVSGFNENDMKKCLEHRIDYSSIDDEIKKMAINSANYLAESISK